MVNIPPRLLYNMENFTTVTITMLTFLQRPDDAEFDHENLDMEKIPE
jgi:hypothetical protein